MDRISIAGGKPLNGTIPISGAKNAALPLMIASLLTPDRLTLKNVPNLADVNLLARILRNHGLDLTIDGKRADPSPHMGETFHLTARDIVDTTAPYELVSRMRASFWVLGPLLARCGEARVSLPGGCAIGTRPVDLHLMGLKALGAEIDIDGGYVVAKAPKGLQRRAHRVPQGLGRRHAQRADGGGAGQGRDRDRERRARARDRRRRRVPRQDGRQDRGHRHRHAAHPGREPPRRRGAHRAARSHRDRHLRLRRGGGRRRRRAAGARARACSRRRSRRSSRPASPSPRRTPASASRATAAALEPITIETQPFPGFPTDLQAQLMALMTKANGTSVIRETIFENRFMHVQELARLGADIQLQGDTATIKGVKALRGAQVMATDLRASVSLVIAGLMAEGKTTINRVYHLDRGFERLEQKLSGCGAQIERIVSG